MTTINEPFFTLLGLTSSSPSGASEYNRIEGKEYPHGIEQPDGGLVECRLPVPLYIVAAAALLG